MNGKFRKTTAFWLLLLLGFSLAVKLSLWCALAAGDSGRFLEEDSLSYHNPATALLRSGAFAVSPDHPTVPETLRTPGYPTFLALVYAVAGERYAAAVLAQIFLSLGTILLVYRLGVRLGEYELLSRPAGRLFPAAAAVGDQPLPPGSGSESDYPPDDNPTVRLRTNVGLVAAALLALDSLSVSFSLLLLSETLFTLLFLAMLLPWLRLAAADSAAGCRGAAAEAGLWLAAATLVRPVAYYLVVPLTIGLVWLAGLRGVSRRQRALLAALFLLPWLIGVGGWQCRNWRQTGSAGFCTIEGVELSWYRAAAVVARRDGINLANARAKLGLPANPWEWIRTHPTEPAARRWKQEAFGVFVAHPFLTARVVAEGMVSTCAGAGDGVLMQLMDVPVDIWRGPFGDLRRLAWREYVHKWFIQAPGVFIAALLASLHLWLVYAGVGLWCAVACRQAPRRHAVEWLIAGLLVYFLLASGTPAASYRFRVPLMPLLCLLAAIGWTQATRPGGVTRGN